MEENKGCLYWCGYLLAIIIIFFLYSAILMWLWNIVVVALFKLPVISYWQSCGLYMVSNILFKNGSDIRAGGKDDKV